MSLVNLCNYCHHDVDEHNENGCTECNCTHLKVYDRVRIHTDVDGRGLKPFDADKLCEKCGYDDIHTAYYDHQEGYFCGWTLGRCQIMGEHMHRQCRRCSYQWVENILIKEADNGN